MFSHRLLCNALQNKAPSNVLPAKWFGRFLEKLKAIFALPCLTLGGKQVLDLHTQLLLVNEVAVCDARDAAHQCGIDEDAIDAPPYLGGGRLGGGCDVSGRAAVRSSTSGNIASLNSCCSKNLSCSRPAGGGAHAFCCFFLPTADDKKRLISASCCCRPSSGSNLLSARHDARSRFASTVMRMGVGRGKALNHPVRRAPTPARESVCGRAVVRKASRAETNARLRQGATSRRHR